MKAVGNYGIPGLDLELHQIRREIDALRAERRVEASVATEQASAPIGFFGVRTDDGETDLIVRGIELATADRFTLEANTDFALIGMDPSLLYANTSVPAGNTVANNSAETAFASLFEILAGTLYEGEVLRLSLAGTIGTDAVAPTLRVKVKYGSAVLLDTTAITLTAGLSGKPWRAECLLTVNSIGATGAIECSMGLEIADALTTVLHTLVSGGAVTVDTTTDADLTVTVDWDVADADNTITLRQMVLEIV